MRCVQTLEPLARARGLSVETAPELEEGGGVAATFDLIGRLDGDGPVALSTHGDIVENVLDRLAARGVPLDCLVAFAKGSRGSSTSRTAT